MESGNIATDDVCALYLVGSLDAQRLNKNELALIWAQKAVEALPNPENRCFLAVALFNMRRYEEARKLAEQALKEDSKNRNISQMVNEMRSAKPDFFNQVP